MRPTPSTHACAVHSLPDFHWHASGSSKADRDAQVIALRPPDRGDSVIVKDGVSLLLDAAEEVGLHLSETIERREHGRRRVAPGRSTRRLTLAQINEYLEKSRQPQDAQARELQVRTLLRRVERPGALFEPQDTSAGTSTDQYLLLQQAIEVAVAESAPAEVIERLEQRLADLEALEGFPVQADLTTIDHAAAFGETAQAVASFQASVHTVLDKPTLVQAFREVLALADRDGRRLDKAIHHLVEALGTCLYAIGSARERALLQTLVTDLYHLKCLNTLFDEARSLVRTVRSLHKTRPRQDRDDGSGA